MRRLLLVLVLCLAVAAAACGLPRDNAPRQIADDKVPFELLGPSTTTPTPTPNVPGGAFVQLYFLDGVLLRAVNRGVPDREPQTVLNELIKGVTDSDPVGITTAIPKDTQIVGIESDGTTLVVTLSNAILTISGAEQQHAFGQLVYTLTDISTSGVRFRVVDANGNAQDVQPLTDVGQKSGPLSRSDFQSLQPAR
jgi:spore germination protein GerM